MQHVEARRAMKTFYRALRRLVLTLCAIATCVSTAHADLVIPNNNAAVEGNTHGNFINAGSPAGQRMLFDIDATQLSGLGGRIAGFALRPDVNLCGGNSCGPFAPMILHNVVITLATTEIGVNSGDTTFAHYLTTNAQVVFQGDVTVSSAYSGPASGPKAFDIVFPFSAAYTYTGGNLVIDIVINGPDGLPISVDAQTFLPNVAAEYFGTATSPTGLFNSNVNVIELLTIGPLNCNPASAAIQGASTMPELRAPVMGGLPLAASILPVSRSVQVGCPATAFATVINAGAATATGVGIGLQTAIPASFTFQTTDPLTNAVTGQPNTPIDIPAGRAQTYVVAVTPTASFGPTDVAFTFGGPNSGPAGTLVGINTLLLSGSLMAVPDIVALAASGDPGVVDIPGAAGIGVFAVATVNVGASGVITATADTGGGNPAVSILLCQTNPATGVCMGPQQTSVSTQINAGQTPTFGIFVTGRGVVPFDPANNRVFVRFKDVNNVTRGATSVAVRTQ
jgi:hypothetical protein